jgi:OmpA-OmpF porin, OOP family
MHKKRLRMWALTGAALSSVSVSAIALAENGRWHDWYLAPQATYILEDSSRDVKDAGGFTGVLGYRLNQRWDIEAHGFYYDYERDHEGHDYQTGLGLDALFVFNRGGRFQPHLSAGFGGQYTDTEEEDTIAPFLNAGVGFRVPIIQDGIAFRMDAKYVYDFTGNLGPEDIDPSLLGIGNDDGGLLGTDLLEADIDDRRGDFQDVRLYAGFELPLGPKESQRVVERIVEVPKVVEKVVEVPEKDSDGDGVPDRLDECPNTPPGTEVDRRGCAKEKQAIALRGVNFAFDRADLTPGSMRILDEAVSAMQGQPSMRVELAGHTDSIGSDGYNLRLSQRRAEAAKRYMGSRGIPNDRMVARGYGETEPIAPNTTPGGADNPEGRALNRRTELRVLEQ